jgi:hypothetical protein
MDPRNHRVEGVVGPRYKFFSNYELLEACNDFVATLDPPATFHEAALAGRRLLLRYKSPRSLCAVPTPYGKMEPFYPGFHFSNSEIGDSSVRTAFALIRQWSGAAAIHHLGRVVHVKGGDFGPKLTQMYQAFRSLAEAELSSVPFESRIAELKKQSLYFGGGCKNHEKRVQALMTRLSRGRFTKQAARRAVNHVLVHGSYGADKVENGAGSTDPAVLEALQGRTAFDLFNALSGCNRRLLPEQQEIAEELAYKLFTNRFKLPS